MDSDNYEVIYCPEDDEYRVHFAICDKLCIERFYKNHLKSQIHTDDISLIRKFSHIPFNNIWI